MSNKNKVNHYKIIEPKDKYLFVSFEDVQTDEQVEEQEKLADEQGKTLLLYKDKIGTIINQEKYDYYKNVLVLDIDQFTEKI